MTQGEMHWLVWQAGRESLQLCLEIKKHMPSILDLWTPGERL